MSSNNFARDTYVTTYGATPVVQIAFMSEIDTSIQVPKFVAVLTTNVKYHFRGRRTFYPSGAPGLFIYSNPALTNKCDPDHTAGEERVHHDSVVMVPAPKLSSGDQEILALRKRLEALLATSMACANGA